MWAEHGSCGLQWPFEGVFHEDPSDKPDWKGECLQPTPGRRRLWQGAGSKMGKHTEAVGRPELVLPPPATRHLARPCTAVLATGDSSCSTSTDQPPELAQDTARNLFIASAPAHTLS